jgi:hypothetical protein
MEPVMTVMSFYLPSFLRNRWYPELAKGSVELASLSDYILRDIGVAS